MNMLMYNVLLFLRSEAQSGNEALLVRMQIPDLIRETIQYMSDTDLITPLQTHPDLITLDFDEALITQILAFGSTRDLAVGLSPTRRAKRRRSHPLERGG